MGTLTIRNLDQALKRKLRERAAGQGISMETQTKKTIAPRKPRRQRSIFDELTRLGVKPQEPFDLKAISDEMWDEGLR
jgi:antitoxin FitA